MAALGGKHGIALQKCRLDDQGIGAADRLGECIDFLGIADDRKAGPCRRRAPHAVGTDSPPIRQHD